MRFLSFLKICGCVLPLFLSTSTFGLAGDPVITSTYNDPLMSAARNEAKKHLPKYLEIAKAPPVNWGDYGVKVGFPTNGNI